VVRENVCIMYVLITQHITASGLVCYQVCVPVVAHDEVVVRMKEETIKLGHDFVGPTFTGWHMQ